MAQPKPSHGLANFIQLNPSVFISPKPEADKQQQLGTSSSSSPPDVILLIAWLNALPRHISKYAAVYTKLYPNARIIAITTDTLNSIFHSQAVNLHRVAPVLDILYNLPPDARILVHSFSNGGGTTLCLLAGAYLTKTGKPLPMTALVLDSAPGRARYAASVRAFTVGLPKNVIVKFLGELFFRVLFGVMILYFSVFGGENPIEWLRRRLNERELFDVEAPRLYVYGDRDVMVDWRDVEDHVADARGKGYVVENLRLEGSGHVSHLVTHEEEYVATVQRLWDSV
ncbi:hypothetical protein F5884DRAFT_194989 [Xylogone sp. PMI_703]|nr:hypothetical protein F5884DRAFT_194989 [Xylogone sp. PMI_703]